MDGDIRNKVKKLLDSPALSVKAMPVDDNPKEPKEEPKEVVMEQKPKLTVAAINKIFKELYDTIHDIHNKIPKKDLIKAATQEIVEMFNNTKLRKNYKLPYKALLISNASDKQSKKAMKYDPFRANIVIKKVLPNLTPEHSQALRSVMKDIPNMPFANLFSKEEPNKASMMVSQDSSNIPIPADKAVEELDDKGKIKQIQEIVKNKPGKAPPMIPAKQTNEEAKEAESKDNANSKPIDTSFDNPRDIDYDEFLNYNTKEELNKKIKTLTSTLSNALKYGGNPINVIYKGNSYLIPKELVNEILPKYIGKLFGNEPVKGLRHLVGVVTKNTVLLPETRLFSTYTLSPPGGGPVKYMDRTASPTTVSISQTDNPDLNIAPPRPSSNPELKITPQQYIHRVYKI